MTKSVPLRLSRMISDFAKPTTSHVVMMRWMPGSDSRVLFTACLPCSGTRLDATTEARLKFWSVDVDGCCDSIDVRLESCFSILSHRGGLRDCWYLAFLCHWGFPSASMLIFGFFFFGAPGVLASLSKGKTAQAVFLRAICRFISFLKVFTCLCEVDATYGLPTHISERLSEVWCLWLGQLFSHGTLQTKQAWHAEGALRLLRARRSPPEGYVWLLVVFRNVSEKSCLLCLARLFWIIFHDSRILYHSMSSYDLSAIPQISQEMVYSRSVGERLGWKLLMEKLLHYKVINGVVTSINMAL